MAPHPFSRPFSPSVFPVPFRSPFRFPFRLATVGVDVSLSLSGTRLLVGGRAVVRADARVAAFPGAL